MKSLGAKEGEGVVGTLSRGRGLRDCGRQESLYRMMTIHAVDDMYSIHDGDGLVLTRQPCQAESQNSNLVCRHEVC